MTYPKRKKLDDAFESVDREINYLQVMRPGANDPDLTPEAQRRKREELYADVRVTAVDYLKQAREAAIDWRADVVKRVDQAHASRYKDVDFGALSVMAQEMQAKIRLATTAGMHEGLDRNPLGGTKAALNLIRDLDGQLATAGDSFARRALRLAATDALAAGLSASGTDALPIHSAARDLQRTFEEAEAAEVPGLDALLEELGAADQSMHDVERQAMLAAREITPEDARNAMMGGMRPGLVKEVMGQPHGHPLDPTGTARTDGNAAVWQPRPRDTEAA